MPVLTGIDVLGVQRFVFASNRLKDVVTGSFLVHWCTSWPGALSSLVAEKNILLASGGNAIVEFDTYEDARCFAAHYTRLLYDKAPGLEVVLVHEEFENERLAAALQNLQIKLARAKTERSPSVPLSGLSVTASCMETGQPATNIDSAETTAPISRNICKRREKRKDANTYWNAFLQGKECFEFPLELDQLGRSIEDTSYLGVVHVDGNGVGKKIKTWLEKVDNGTDDNIVRREYREWSAAIDKLGNTALQAVVDRLCQGVDRKSSKVIGTPDGLSFDLHTVNGGWMLPIRPILLGGDDLTFVCDGRIALDLAETALGVFEHSNIPHLGNISASAGIAIVRVHAPFARAYELSEKLCRSAKGKLKEKNNPGCALDWHIGIARPGESVTTLREKQYEAKKSDSSDKYRLTCKPYLLGSGKDDTETWRWLSRMLLDDKNCGLRGERWSERRNKVKALSELVREGPKRVRSANSAWRIVDSKLQLPFLDDVGGFFDETRTPLLDAVELLALHLVLENIDHEQATESEVNQ
jgi:hypothetical protein